MAYYSLLEFGIKPKELMEMDRFEKAFIYAAIDIKIEVEKKRAKDAERAAGCK